MADITYNEWIDKTAKRFARRSSELKAVDKAFKEWEQATTGGSRKTGLLQELAKVFKLWINFKGQDNYLDSIRNRKVDEQGFGPVERLQTLIRTHQSSNVGIRRELNAHVPDRLVLEASLRNLKDESKVRETYNRANLAVHAARDAMLKATGAGAERNLYVRWFGTFDVARHKDVLANYKRLCKLFDSGVLTINDARTMTNGWQDTFGFAMPGRQDNYVEFTVGKAFFLKTGYNVVSGATAQQRSTAIQQALKNAYAESSDWTVGTMVHELSHATNGLPDVDFRAPSTYQVSAGGLGDGTWTQVSTPQLDLDLAAARPELAVRNVDNYGQCAREALIAKGQ